MTRLGTKRIISTANRPLGSSPDSVKCPFCGEMQKNGMELRVHAKKIHSQRSKNSKS